MVNASPRQPRRGVWRMLVCGGGLVSLVLGAAVPARAASPTIEPVIAVPLVTTAAAVPAGYNSHLTRAPYLTDLVGRHVAINYATDRSATSGKIEYGAVGAAGACAPKASVTATRTAISVGTVREYQWTAQVDLPADGTYCYRVYLKSTDLLGTNASPRFTTQVPAGSTTPFTFDVLGDWGSVDSSGTNPDQANLMAQIASSGARFAVTVGDNGYPNGNQINYGDLQQTGPATSAIFGPSFWTVPGATTPIFTAAGNHGLSGPTHTDITTWTQSRAVSTSGGRYQNDVYCCVNASASSNYASEWYAFNAGNVRFYILDSAWGDANGGTATPYANDAAAHFAPGDPEYEWLLNDLQSHPSQLKFAFSHYPIYVDNPTESSDTFLQGPAGLEGLLARYGVNIVFNGHTHIYERNLPSAAGMPITYVTGGGGGTLEPVGPCSGFDAYGIGWSPTRLQGSSCGGAPRPTAAAGVYHFLKVTVAGTQVTVTPTDSLGDTFDVHTYTFAAPPDTYIDSGPAAVSNSTSATFTFHATDDNATFACSLDGGDATACTSPMTYSGLTPQQHTFAVAATVGGLTDASPATATFTVDTTPPPAPSDLNADTPSPFEVDLTWTAASEADGVVGYRIYRDGVLYRTLGAVTSITDAVTAGSTHEYSLTALDEAGNESAPAGPISVTTPTASGPVFSDGFESGNFSAWTSHGGLVVQSSTVEGGNFAAEGNTTTGATYAKKTLPATYPDGYARVVFDIVAQSSQVNLLRLRNSSGASLCYVYVDSAGRLGYHNDALGTNSISSVVPGPGWHTLELRRLADGSGGTGTGAIQIWLDNSLVGTMSSTALETGAAPVGAMQIGETQTGRTYDVVFDDAAFGTSRLGPVGGAARIGPL